jgi:hypothetical protein
LQLAAAIIVVDSRSSCELRLDRATAEHSGTKLIALESFDELARGGR